MVRAVAPQALEVQEEEAPALALEAPRAREVDLE